MATQKLYAGAKLREVRTRIGHTQKDFAARLGVSLPYLNQMENNNRPVSTTVVLSLAQEFGLDVTELSEGDSERLVSDMREAVADPLFTDAPPPLQFFVFKIRIRLVQILNSVVIKVGDNVCCKIFVGCNGLGDVG